MHTPVEEWQVWESLSISRLPLSFILDAKKRGARTQMAGFSDSAFVHRMFDLFFTMRQNCILERISPVEKDAFEAFQHAWDSLPWTPIAAHPHVSELPSSDFSLLVPPAKRLDRLLSLRTGDTLVAAIYRLLHGWKKQRMPREPSTPFASYSD